MPFTGRTVVVAALAVMLGACANPRASSTPVAIDVVVATVQIPGQPLAVVLGPDGAPWVVTGLGGSVTRVDPATNVPGEPLEVPTGIAAASGVGSLWIGSGAGTLSRVDPGARSIVASIPTGSQANAVAVAFGSVWTTDFQANTLLRIDPSTNQVVARIGLGGLPIAIVDGGGSLWVLSLSGGSIARVDPAANQVVGTVAPEQGRQDLAFLNGTLYAVGASDFGSGGGFVERIDPTSLQTTGRAALTVAAYHIAAGTDALWVSLTDGRTVAKVDPVSLLTTASVPVGGKPQGLAVSAGSVWVAVEDPDGLVRIATGR
jgi:hypothetical protein